MSDEENPETGGTRDPDPNRAPEPDAQSASEAPADSSEPDTPDPDTPEPDTPEPGAPEPEPGTPAEDPSASEPAVPGTGSAADPGPPPLNEPTTDSLPPLPGPHGSELPGPYSSDPSTVPVTRQLPGDDGFAPVDGPPSEPLSAETPVVRSSPRRRGTWRTVALISAAVVLLAVIAGVGTELYVRNKVTSCLETAFGDMTGTSTSVSVPRGPMLGAWFTGEVAWVQVDTNDSASGSAMRLHARADEVSRDGRSVGSLRGTAFVPYDRIQDLTGQQGADGAQIESVTGNGGAGTITIDSSYQLAFLSVPATVVLKPTVEDGRVEFRVDEAKAFGIGLPNDFAQQLVDQVAEAMLGPLFSEIAVESMEVTDQGIDFTFAGDDVNLQATSQVSGSSSGCGV